MRKESSQESEGFLLDKRAAASVLGVSVRMIDYLLQDGRLRAKKIGRRVLIRREDLRCFAEKE